MSTATDKDKTIYQFEVKDLAGNKKDLSNYEGQVLLIVNTASRCGFTPQLKGLEEVHQEFKDQGFTVLGFPCNQFGGQEPLEGEQITEFCEVNYGVSFPMFSKVDVKGSNAHPLFSFFSDKKRNGKLSRTPKWNFHKFLVDREGRIVDHFFPFTKPNRSRVKSAIKKLI